MSQQQERVLKLAREVWQSAPLDHRELRQGVERVAFRLRQGQRKSRSPRLLSAVAVAAVSLVTLAYASGAKPGSSLGSWDSFSRHLRGLASLHGDTALKANGAWQEGQFPGSTAAAAPISGPSAAEAWAPYEAADGSRGGALRGGEQGLRDAPSSEAGGPPSHAQATAELLLPWASFAPSQAGALATSMLGSSALAAGAIQISPESTASPKTARHEGRQAGQHLATGPGAARQPSWHDVNRALVANNHAEVERLLSRLAAGGESPNTRAKARLGLAQLEASRGHCEKAAQIASRVAATPGVEIKTVRRALELATRCKP